MTPQQPPERRKGAKSDRQIVWEMGVALFANSRLFLLEEAFSITYTGNMNLTALFEQELQTFQKSYEKLFSTMESYPQDKQTLSGVCGEWSARDVLAHINGWIVEAQRRYPRFAKGTGKIDYNIDAFNAVSIRLRADKDFEQILEETRSLVDKLVSMAGELPEVYIERDERYTKWLHILIEEADNHGHQLQDFLETTQ